MSTPSAAAGPAVRDFPPRRPFQGGGRFDKPVLSQEQIDVLIRQARDNAKRLMLDALQKTDPKYRSFLVPIGQWKKDGERGDRDIKAYFELPYMSGYGWCGAGLDSAEEMITALGGDPSRPEVTRNAGVVKAAAGAHARAATTAPAAESTPALEPRPRSPEAAALVEPLAPKPGPPEASHDGAAFVEPLAAEREQADRSTTSAPPAGDSQILLDALNPGTLDRDRLAAAATTLLKVPEAGYIGYLTRTFGVRGPGSLSAAQLKKEIEFLLRRTQHPDQAERFRMQCERLAQPAA